MFQFTHPGGVRPLALSRCGCSLSVSIHAPGRGATSHDSKTIRVIPFQFTHPGGVRLHSLKFIAHIGEFQFTHPGGVRQSSRETHATDTRFQFTHPGGVRLRIALGVISIQVVSIHAPGRGATCLQARHFRQASCFNSRTREGCDLRGVAVAHHDGCRFNSRTREGCDWRQSQEPGAGLRFNSRTREGCDKMVSPSECSPMFQFTHPGGVRLTANTSLTKLQEFQFTHPGGVRLGEGFSRSHATLVSIHAPGRGATVSIASYLIPF